MYKLACALFLLAAPALADMQAARDAFQAGQFAEAETQLLPAARSGNAEAEFLLGTLHSLGLGTTQDTRRGFEFYMRAASKGHPAAQLRVARAYETGTGIAADPVRALLWARLAEIGMAEGAASQAARLAANATEVQKQAVSELLNDYRLYLFPFARP